MRQIRRAGVAWLTLALLLMQGGCATVSRPPRPLSPEARAELGRLGLVSGRFVPAIDVQRPTTGRGSAAVRGAALAAGSVLPPFSALAVSCTGRECGLVVIVMFGVLLGVATVGALTGAVVGAATAESAAQVHDAEAALTRALAELKIQEALRDRIVTIAGEDTHLVLVPGGDVGPTESDMAVDYRPLAAQGLDTILEVSVIRLGLTGDRRRVNPPLALSIAARIRLLRSGDGAELYHQELNHRSGSRKFVEWAANDAEAFREAMDAAYTDISRQIIRLVLPPPVQGPELLPTPPPPALEPSLSTVPLNVWKTAPIGEQGVMVRYQLIEKGSPLDTCTPPLVSVRIYEAGVECVPAELLK
jgi:hypothetical protein